MSNFAEELKNLTEQYHSDKLRIIQGKLKLLASSGKRTATFDWVMYDTATVAWLKAQGLQVEEVEDMREGNFIRVSW